MAYTKLDSGITESTIWQAPDATRLVWITMLARADQNGYVGASMPGLAGLARVALDDCIAAIEQLEAPDKWSRTKDHEGRRIAPADGGWVLLNYAKYRALQNADDRRERSRLAMAALRERRKHLLTVNGSYQSCSELTQAEAEADTEEKKERDSGASPSAKLPPPSFAGDVNIETIPSRAIVALSPDWELPQAWGVDAERLGWPGGAILKEAEKFRQYWVSGKGAGKRRTVKGWRQSWSNWIAKAGAYA